MAANIGRHSFSESIYPFYGFLVLTAEVIIHD